VLISLEFNGNQLKLLFYNKKGQRNRLKKSINER